MKMHRKFAAAIAALFVFSFLVFGHTPMFSVQTAEAGFFDWLPWVDSEAEVTAEGEVAVETEDGVLEIWWEYFVGLFGFADDDTEEGEDADDEDEEEKVESSSSPEGAMMELKAEEAVEAMVEGGTESSQSSAMEGSSSPESSTSSSAAAEEGAGISASAEVEGEVEVKTAE